MQQCGGRGSFHVPARGSKQPVDLKDAQAGSPVPPYTPLFFFFNQHGTTNGYRL